MLHVDSVWLHRHVYSPSSAAAPPSAWALPPLTCLPPSGRASAQRGLSWPNCTKQHPQCQPLRCLTAFKMPAILWHVIYLFCVCVCYASVPVESKLFGGRTGLFCFLLNLQKLHLTLRRDPPPYKYSPHCFWIARESRIALFCTVKTVGGFSLIHLFFNLWS